MGIPDNIEPDDEFVGGDVPIPDELTEENDQSARYDLPDDLVRYKYSPLSAQFVRQTVPLTDRIVVAVPTNPDGVAEDHLGPYEEVARALETQFGIQVARLRHLLAACRLSEERKLALMDQRELERVALNWRNSCYNTRIATDLSNLKSEWSQARQDYHSELRQIEELLIDQRIRRQADLDDARSAYWAVREKWSQLRDEEVAAAKQLADEATTLEAERERVFREKSSEVSEKTIADREQQRVELRAAAAEASRLALEADETAWQVETDVIDRCCQASATARIVYEEALQAAYISIDTEADALRSEAIEIESSLLEELRERTTWLHSTRAEAIAEQRDRESSLHEANIEAATAAANAGLAPGEVAADPRHALCVLLSEDVVAEETGSKHLFMSPPSRWQPIAETLAQVALGCIFGVSLSLLANLVNFTTEGLKRGGVGTAIALSVCAILGIFIYYLMGRLARRAATYASEEFHAEGGTKARLAALALGMVLVTMVGLEACVERYGIVQALMHKELVEGGTNSVDSNLTVYWAIALVFAAPFAAYHAYEGSAETRRHLASRRRREHLAAKQYESATNPRLSQITESQEKIRALRFRHDTVDADYKSAFDEAMRRIAEIEHKLKAHPAILRWGEYEDSRDALLRGDPILTEARLAWERAEKSHLTDPIAVAARQKAAEARDRANSCQQKAENADSILRQALEEAARGIIAHTGAGLASALSERASQAIDVASAAVTTAVTAGLTGIPSLPVGLLPPAFPVGDLGRESYEESMAKERWISLRNAIGHDPKIRFYQGRILSIKAAIHGIDSQYGKRRKALFAQQRAIELRLTSGENGNTASVYFDRAIEEEELNTKASKLSFDLEFLRLKQLAESPRFWRWYVLWMQGREAHAALSHQMHAAANASAFELLSRQPSSNQPKIGPANM